MEKDTRIPARTLSFQTGRAMGSVRGLIFLIHMHRGTILAIAANPTDCEDIVADVKE